jgi:hypothetical protein
MKYLSEIMEKRQSELFKNKKVFFAFSGEQFKEGIKKSNLTKETKMVNMGQGMFCPSENVKEVIDQMDLIYKESIAEDMRQGKGKVILRELYNHECFYTGDITDCIEKLSDYPITEEEIKNVYFKNYKNEI